LLRSIKELNPLFERFGIAAISELLQREIAAESNKISARMYTQTENKLAGIANASVAFEPELLPSSDYTQLPATLPVVTVFEGVVSVDGVVCEYACVDVASNMIRWSRQVSSNKEYLIEHGALMIEDPRYFSALGQVCYSTDYTGQDLLDLPPFQYLSYGSQCEIDILDQSLDVSKQQLNFQQPAFEEVKMESKSEEDSSIATIESNDVSVDAAPTTAIQAQEVELKEPAMHFQMAAEVAAPVQELKFVTRPKQFDMVFDDLPLQESQTAIQRQVDFGPMQLATQRVTSDGTPGIMFSDIVIPNLDSLLDPINANLNLTDGTKMKLERLYDTAVTIEAGPGKRVKATVSLAPTTLEILHQLQDEKAAEDPSKTVTFKTNLQSDVSLPMLYARIEMTFSPDSTEVVSGTLWEYNFDSSKAGAEGIRSVNAAFAHIQFDTDEPQTHDYLPA
jgi:hypothetical protein